MFYLTIPPPPQLAPYVRSFWVLGGEASVEKPYIYRSFADGCPELICHYKGSFKEITPQGAEASPLFHLHGQSQHYKRYIATENFEIFGAYLFPFSTPLLFNIPGYEAANLTPDVESLMGLAGKELEEKMILAHNTTQRAQLLIAFLECRLLKKGIIQPAVFASIRQMLHKNSPMEVSTLADTYNLSVRQFERKFKEYSGFSPRLYARITRFQRALRKYGTPQPLTEIGYQCGYYDQSHFIRDFKAFSGHHPKTYFGGKAEGAEYLDI